MANQHLGTIHDFITSVEALTKSGSDSTPLSEAGSIGGDTTHPVKKVDDRLEKAKEGERSKENSADVKKEQGPPSVETKAASVFGVASRFAKKADEIGKPGTAHEDHISSTLNVQPTGKDPANETASAKAGKEDKKEGGVGGTTHPASTENNSLDGNKYAEDTPLEKLAGDMQACGNQLLTVIHNLYQNGGVTPAGQTASVKQAESQTIDANLAFMAGHELAGLVNGTMDKRAADKMVSQALSAIVKQANDDADMLIAYASNFFQKQAEEPPPETPGGDPTGGGGDGPPMSGGAQQDPNAMLSALGGGQPGEDGSGMPGSGVDPEAEKLLQILEQLHVTPEELQQALEQEQSGGGGGMPGGGGGSGGGVVPGMETTASVGGGKKLANEKNAAEMANYIAEIVNRSRIAKR